MRNFFLNENSRRASCGPSVFSAVSLCPLQFLPCELFEVQSCLFIMSSRSGGNTIAEHSSTNMPQSAGNRRRTTDRASESAEARER